jgi:small subunit ribosomal protein S1
MGQIEEWIPPHVPPDESYWEALLRDGQNGPGISGAQSKGWTRREANITNIDETSTASEENVLDPWNEARALMEQEKILKLPVVGANRGGLLVGWNGLQGFVPASHLLNLSPFLDGVERQAELHRFIGTQIPLKIIELDSEQQRFVLSERATRVDEHRRDELLSTLSPGDVCEGRVTNICSFGVFVDLGGFEGLIHISELAWGRIDHPSDVLEPGQMVSVYVLNVDPERERVGLSLKRLQPDPWQAVEEVYSAGQIIEGTVTHVVNFGAFVQIDEDLEGLIHISEMGDESLNHPSEIIQEEDQVRVQILNVDGDKRRMGLRLLGDGSDQTKQTG